MKSLFRILIVATCFAIIYVYSEDRPNENTLLEGPNQTSQAIPKKQYEEHEGEVLPRPTSGMSLYIGDETDHLIKDFGLPLRIDHSEYGFEWWTYQSDNGLIMFSVADQQVVQVYTNSAHYATGPYKIGQSIDDIYRMTILEYEVFVQLDDSVYLFSMSDQDMKNRLLVVFDGVYAQLYIDEKQGTLNGIRYMDGKTLVVQQPYDMQYVGDLIQRPEKTSFQQIEVNEAETKQLEDITNAFRAQAGVPTLLKSPTLSELATAHSEDMFLENYVSHDSPKFGSLKDRLASNEFEFDKAGENVATGYYDAIEVIHGWLNSTDHRKELLSENYSHFGGGAYIDYYTLILTKNNSKPYERN